jgi:endonuclease III
MKLSDLKIGEPAHRALSLIGIQTLEECVDYTKKELLALHGVGPKAIRIIEEELIKQNLKYKK